MNRTTLPLDYANTLLYEMEKAFWDERGKGARFRMTQVGSQYFKDKIFPLLKSDQVEELLKTVEGVLCRDGIAENITTSPDGRLVRVRLNGCLHQSVEANMLAQGVEPFTCVPANLMVMAVEEKLNRPVELAEIRVVEGACELLLVIFEGQPTLG